MIMPPCLISSTMVMTTLYTYCNSFFQKDNGLSDGKAISMTKNKYGFLVRFLYKLLNSSKSISDK